MFVLAVPDKSRFLIQVFVMMVDRIRDPVLLVDSLTDRDDAASALSIRSVIIIQAGAGCTNRSRVVLDVHGRLSSLTADTEGMGECTNCIILAAAPVRVPRPAQALIEPMI